MSPCLRLVGQGSRHDRFLLTRVTKILPETQRHLSNLRISSHLSTGSYNRCAPIFKSIALFSNHLSYFIISLLSVHQHK